MESGRASRTSVFVCQGRAAADGRLAVGTFADPVAAQLLTSDELAPVDVVRAGSRPPDGRQRFVVESVRACAEVVMPRTVLVDRAVTAALGGEPDSQVVLVGAGLDGRPWRLAALRDVPVFSVDHPASQADTRRRAAVAALEPLGDLRFVPVDLTAVPLGPALGAAGHDRARTTVWVWEGVVPYLTRAQVSATVDAITRASAPGSTLVVTCQVPSITASLGRRMTGLVTRLSRVESPLSDEPWKSTWRPARFAELMASLGWRVMDDESLLDAAHRIGSPTGRSRSLANGRVLTARR